MVYILTCKAFWAEKRICLPGWKSFVSDCIKKAEVEASHQVAKALALVLRMNIQGWFPLGLTDLISLLSKVQSIYYEWRIFWSIQKGKIFLSYPHLQPISQMCNSLQSILQSVNDDGFSLLLSFNTKEMNNISLVAQVVKNPTAICRLRFDPWVEKILLEKEMAAYSTIFAWEIPWTEGPSRLQSMGSQRIGHKWATNTFISLTTYLIQTAISFHRNNFSDLLIGYSFKFFLPHSTFTKAIHFHLLKSS